ncbi:Radiation response metalloprotease IrrE [Calidithermus terrae]|uniref:Radiation response metalloprotease IrrE n=1 Tax=Calidithermus terrae TaxID=1408545 RepID=A0A399EIH9_9DEIN|nr:ImmA/IrrE family metallo-endopeptidase [Calidithermus terrae]RIH82889.1 Radiation response metalloprotease IrrE [Calidithermus terrae]
MDLRSRIIRMAREYRQAHAPLTAERLVRGIGVSLAYAKLPEGKFGAFIEEQQRIVIDEDSPPKRQRFTLAHEVMHHLIRNDADVLSDLHEEFEGGQLEAQLEALCNLGAAEMLLPGEVVEAAIARKGQSPRLIPELAEGHQVSEEVAIIALAERGPTPSLVLMAGAKPLRVFFSAKHERVFDRVSRGAAVHRDHPLAVALETGLPYRGKATLPGHPTLYSLEAYPKGGRVYAVFRELQN